MSSFPLAVLAGVAGTTVVAEPVVRRFLLKPHGDSNVAHSEGRAAELCTLGPSSGCGDETDGDATDALPADADTGCVLTGGGGGGFTVVRVLETSATVLLGFGGGGGGTD
jgi:hypothetical protein